MSARSSTYPTAVLGYRCFDLLGHELRGQHKKVAWEPGVNQARCTRNPEHQPPMKRCRCGIYSFHRPQGAQDRQRRCGGVIGAIAGRGQVQLTHDGVIVQEAQILGLCRSGARSAEAEQLDRVANAYQVPLFDSIGELEEHAERFAAPAPEQAIPPPISVQQRWHYLWLTPVILLLAFLVGSSIWVEFTMSASALWWLHPGQWLLELVSGGLAVWIAARLVALRPALWACAGLFLASIVSQFLAYLVMSPYAQPPPQISGGSSVGPRVGEVLRGSPGSWMSPGATPISSAGATFRWYACPAAGQQGECVLIGRGRSLRVPDSAVGRRVVLDVGLDGGNARASTATVSARR